MRHSVTVSVTVVAAGLLAGCAATPTGQPASPAASASDAPRLDGGGEASPQPYPTWNQPAAVAAREVALAAMREFTRTDRDPPTWLEALAPYLTPAAHEAHYGTDPAQVPAHHVRDATVTPGPSPYLANATVATDVGDYQLLLVRAGADSTWLVDTITPPPQVGP